MWRHKVNTNLLQYATRNFNKRAAAAGATAQSLPEVPSTADVVIIGGGSAGCHTLYHLAKRGVKAVLLERAKLTAGTTWHTPGVLWRLRATDVDVQLLHSSRQMLKQLELETGMDPGWIQNGGMFIAHNKERLNEFKRLSSLGHAFGIENYLLSPEEAKTFFPLLDANAFYGALYTPGDGAMDPSMLIAALTHAAKQHGAKIIENCPVNDFLTENKKIIGVATPFGDIKSEKVVNATGVWARDLIEKYGTKLPLLPIKHSYVVTESIPGVRGLPNLRSNDFSTYFRVQGDTIFIGGYEKSPVMLDAVAKDFQFGLYDFDWNLFEEQLEGAQKLCPTYKKYGIKRTICGPESFTPDHKPLLGPDPELHGLYHNCGFNSTGMMFGGGCGEQTALWVLNERPELPMHNYDLRRFSPMQTRSAQWIKERVHESYAHTYSILYKHDLPLAARNLQKDPLHNEMLQANAYMEQCHGWERPAFFMQQPVEVMPYDWYGSYGHQKNNSAYERVLHGDLQFGFSEHHKPIGAEALACRHNAVVFNMSYFAKFYLEGPQAQLAADWIFCADTKSELNKATYTCMLNHCGGIEGDALVTRLTNGSGVMYAPKFDGQCYYIVANGAYTNYLYENISSEIRKKGFNAHLRDATSEMGVISIQGPNSRKILQRIVDVELSDANLPKNSTVLFKCAGIESRLLRVSYVGELGYEIHVPKSDCSKVYNALMTAGAADDLRNAGYRAMYSLHCEKGYPMWSQDMRADDTPLEVGLAHICRKDSVYLGSTAIENQRNADNLKQRRVYLTLNEQVPLFGTEGLYRNDVAVGFVRRAEYGYTLGKPVALAYVQRKGLQSLNDDFIAAGDYELNIMGKRYKAQCHLKAPLDV